MKYLLLFLSITLLAGQIEVTWPNTSKEYFLSYGTKELSNCLTVRTNRYILDNPTKGQTYFFSVMEIKNDKFGPESERIFVFVPKPTNNIIYSKIKLKATYKP